jgi:hypothetical protein
MICCIHSVGHVQTQAVQQLWPRLEVSDCFVVSTGVFRELHALKQFAQGSFGRVEPVKGRACAEDADSSVIVEQDCEVCGDAQVRGDVDQRSMPVGALLHLLPE